MGGSKLKMVRMLVLLLIILGGRWSEGCLDHERFALLRLKLFFDDPYNYLHDWVDDEGATDCCQWEKVECSNTTGRVLQLELNSTRNWEWYLNASLFTPFQQLESLSLSGNYIAGCVENEGLERLSRLTNLKILDLSGNSFNNSILLSVARLSSLKSLNLNGNGLEGSIDIKELDSLRDLEELDIGVNQIDKFVVSKGLSTLKSLGLSGIKLNRSILSSLTVFSSLRELYLSETGFKGTLDVREFDSFNNLEVLDMSYNEIDNLVVPQGYKGLRKLKSLYLQGVGIRDGSKLLQSMGSFPSLNTLDLSINNFTGTVTTTQELHNFTNLEYLTLDYSSLHISLLQSIASFTSLKNLSMSNCEVNGVLRDQGLERLSRLTNLKMLDLSYNSFNNNILSSLALVRLSSLTSLSLDGNRLEGSIDV